MDCAILKRSASLGEMTCREYVQPLPAVACGDTHTLYTTPINGVSFMVYSAPPIRTRCAGDGGDTRPRAARASVTART